MITGKKVKLRILEKDDIGRTTKWFNDFEIVKPLNRLPFCSFEQEEEWYSMVSKSKNTLVLAIEVENDTHIGNIALNLIDIHNRNAVISIVIGDKKFWGKGFGKDAVLTLVDYAFNELGLHKIYTHIISFNERSLKLFEKCGFEKEGTLREWYYSDGKFYDKIIYSILNKETKNK